jgi:hypothetical protein
METRENMPNPVRDCGTAEAPHNPAGSSTMSITATNPGGGSPATPSSHSAGGQPGEANPVNKQVKVEAPDQVDVTKRHYWVTEVKRSNGYSVGWRIKSGQVLTWAKEDLPHGEWMAIFKTRQLSFSLRTAELRMAVARHPTLGNREYFSNLPSGWSALYVLSRLSVAVLEQAILDGTVHPDLKVAEAKRLLSAEANGPANPAHPTPLPFDLGREKTCLLGRLRRQTTRWPSQYRGELATLLEGLAAELRSATNA